MTPDSLDKCQMRYVGDSSGSPPERKVWPWKLGKEVTPGWEGIAEVQKFQIDLLSSLSTKNQILEMALFYI